MKHGIPFDTAHALLEGGPEGEAEALAYAVVLGELEGSAEFDWGSMTWRERDH